MPVRRIIDIQTMVCFLAVLLLGSMTDSVKGQTVDDVTEMVDTLQSLVSPELPESLDSVGVQFPLAPSPSQVAPALAADSLLAQAQAMLHPPFRPDPQRALWLSLILPGAGQIYNRKYWKLPIIYGGFLGCIYALSWNNQMLSDYSQAYLDIMDKDPDTKSYEKMLPLGYNISGREEQFKEIFKNKKNYYRKYRDMSIFAFAAVYALAVIDAYVDAELSSFDISEDLSFRMAPAIITSSQPAGCHASHLASWNQSQGLGVAFRLNF